MKVGAGCVHQSRDLATSEISVEHFNIRQPVKPISRVPRQKGNRSKSLKGAKWSSETPKCDFKHGEHGRVSKRAATGNRKNVDPKKYELPCIFPSKNVQRKKELKG